MLQNFKKAPLPPLSRLRTSSFEGLKMVKEEKLLKALMGLGLKEVDAEIYVFLAKNGPRKGKDISEALSLYKQQLYRSLKRLQRQCFVEAAHEHPSRFSAASIGNVIDVLVGANLAEAHDMAENRQRILSYWQAMMKRDYTR